MNLDYFFKEETITIPEGTIPDEEGNLTPETTITQSILKQAPSLYKLEDAIVEVNSGEVTLTDAAYKLYDYRMWQWYSAYKLWVSKGSKGTLFEQPLLSDSELEVSNHFRQVFKAIRTDLVQKSTVTIGDKVYDADEDSQRRLMAAILSAVDDEETTIWVLHDNSITYLNRIQLKEVLRACTLQMSSVWVAP